MKAGKYYSDAVIWAKDEGVVNGITETTFDPNGKITREQLATMLARFSERCPVSVPERADLSGYPDADKIHNYAKDALAWANEANLIKGMSDGTLSPRGEATREQFATILKRFDETFTLAYNKPAVKSHYTEPEYPLVDNADIYVATDGNDSNPGTFDAPLATFAGAAAKVREIKATMTSGDIIVAFKTGDYGPLSVSLTAEDSGTPDQRIIYCKYGDGDVTFNNGVDLTADDFVSIDETDRSFFSEKNADNVKKYDVSDLFAGGLDGDSLLLFRDGGICVTARFPNKYEDGTDALLNEAADTVDQHHMILTHSLLRKRFSDYTPADFENMQLYGYIVRGYAKDSCTVTGYDSEDKVITIGVTDSNEYGGHLRDGWNGIKMCVKNVPRELDSKGEYWIDRHTATLYVYAPEGNYHIPAGGDMIRMEGTNCITFRGLTFRNAAGSFIKGHLCHGVTLDLCGFSGTTVQEGVRFEDCDLDRPLDLAVTNSQFSLAYGQSFAVFGGCEGRYRYTKRANVLFDNNLVTSSNLIFDFLNSVHLEYCSGLTVTHNDFVHTSRGAVSFDHSYDVLIEYNNFDSVMENSEDGGAVYNWGSVDGWSIRVCHNYFGPMHRDGMGCFGYYIDDYSDGADVFENIFYNAVVPVMIHNGRDNVVRDNLIIDTESHGEVWLSHGSRSMIDELGYEEAVKQWPYVLFRQWWADVFDLIETYPEYRAGVEKWCPGFLDCTMDPERVEDPEFYLNPVNSIYGNVCFNPAGEGQHADSRDYYVKYVVYGDSLGVPLDENPCFVNPTVGDYRIREGADFPDIEFEKTGRY